MTQLAIVLAALGGERQKAAETEIEGVESVAVTALASAVCKRGRPPP